MFLTQTNASDGLSALAELIKTVFGCMANVKIPFASGDISIFTIAITVVLLNLFIIILKTVLGTQLDMGIERHEKFVKDRKRAQQASKGSKNKGG